MAIVWLVIGAGVAWFVFSYRATKARVRQVAAVEFAQFITAIDAWNADRDDYEGLTRAFHHYAVYDIRRGDATGSPTGLSIPPERALLARYWVEHLTSARLLDSDGRASRWHEGAVSFWSSVDRLREERDKLLLQSHYGA